MSTQRATRVPAFAVVPTALALLTVLRPSPVLRAQASGAAVDPARYGALEFRMVGPHRGGRVTAVAGVAGDPRTYYMGSTGGGVWKTTDAGLNWENVSDGFFDAGSMGALAVAPSDGNVIYAGTGSACVRGNVSTGVGLYRSTDGGESWRFAGLPDAGQIGRIEVHPDDPDRLWVAALGHPFGPNPERGVYRSTDGGESWERVLFVSDSTGAVDLSMNPGNPRVLYAAMWRAERKPWTLISGAREGGIYKTTDGGESWTRLEEGLPDGLVGKIGVSVSPADPSRVYAVVEAGGGQGGVYRSDDAGRSWTRVNADNTYIERPWYYNHIDADPRDPNTVYINGEELWKSTNGGRTFEEIPTPHGDNHAIWLNPEDPEIMIQGNDGGANVSLNGGRSWSPQVNQPTAEFYSVTLDDAFPYRIYGPQQDNSTISVPAWTEGSGITIQRWIAVGGCETGPIAVRPGDPAVIYAGCYGGRLNRYERGTGQFRQITPYPEIQLGRRIADLEYRFQWNSPIVVSPHDPDVLYHASNVVHRSRNEGQSWAVISPDLTRADTTRMGYAGEPITHDITGVEVYGTVFALRVSPHDPNVIWAGSNDGLVHVTMDGDRNWRNVTPSDLPSTTTINRIEVSPHSPGKAYLAAFRYRMDDFRPYLFRTTDYGRSWTRIADGTNGIPADHPTRVIREDPGREGLLYAGTEFGLFVSFDDGDRWQSLQQNLPHTPVTDLKVQEELDDLVVATQGRSFWVLDDLEPLREVAAGRATASATHLYRPEDAYRTPGSRPDPDDELVRDPTGGARLPVFWAGANPPAGARIYYYLDRTPGEPVALEVLDAAGEAVRSFRSDEEASGLSADAGMHRFAWDLKYPGADLVEDASVSGFTGG
ncbi:MAG: glycosyl hydrolase, partial [Gemmatimonadetes bacterium]|nr:glycosyl hydrolase [Gemmatimonadota bacterium]NIR81088.1 glycosyl hydrolase [Gemmatimonadota bacterium]NIT89906.1 glycosyl hydrolase [Gemmatimonadota bacterium]NIU33705.1 glycosyl hydrolase [Gemmatimonadota bacterium]NIU37948.1 glycosyl hydrolase [Gemmatimonadota bacterium]